MMVSLASCLWSTPEPPVAGPTLCETLLDAAPVLTPEEVTTTPPTVQRKVGRLKAAVLRGCTP